MLAHVLMLVAFVALPYAIVRSKIAKLSHVLVTFPVTWLVVTVGMYVTLMSDNDPLTMLLVALFIVLPCATVIPATVAATLLAKPRGSAIAAAGVALLGLVIALGVLFTIGQAAAAMEPHPIVSMAFAMALPAMWSACGALYGASVSARRV
jgi:hypothetical protein